jgi:TIR domain
MKIFLSWSKDSSKLIAEALKEWIPNVIQAARPWFSSTDIERGARWNSEIAVELQTTKFGIICVTPENQKEPWINFESGALAKTLTDIHVAPVLFNMEPTDLVGPLSQFNATRLIKEDMQKLIHTINSSLENPLGLSKVDQSFEMWWPKLEEKIEKIRQKPNQNAEKAEKRTDRDILEEILTLVRSEKQREGFEKRIAESLRRINAAQSDASNLKGGEIVTHPKFGRGKLLAVSGSGTQKEEVIQFEDGGNPKKMLLGYANLDLVRKQDLDIDVNENFSSEET